MANRQQIKTIVGFIAICLLGLNAPILMSANEKADKVIIDKRCSIPDDQREYYSRYVNFRPVNGQKVSLNPPRFSWGYLPDIVTESEEIPVNQRFTLQISKTEDFRELEVEAKDIGFNFYNTLPKLHGSNKWFWRVGYNVGTAQEKWSDSRSFTISSDAIDWDRSTLVDPDLASRGHPRILFNPKNIDNIRALRQNHLESAKIAEQIKKLADKVLLTDWWNSFPKTDSINPDDLGLTYNNMSEAMVAVAFAYILFEDEKYLGCKERFLTIASWEMGGWSSPEGLTARDVEFKEGPVEARTRGAQEDATKTTGHLALFFDWFYNDLNRGERGLLINSIEWRLDHSMNNFCWRGDRQNKRPGKMSPYSIAMISQSHQFECLMDNLPACLAIYEHSQVAKEAFDMGVNYLMGVTNGFGFEEAWNEGSGYGNSKMKWLLDATICFDTVFPEIDFSKNPYYCKIGDFFIHLAPVGLQHSSFGNGAVRQRRLHDNRILNFRKLAYLTGKARYLENREQSLKMFRADYFHPWIEYILPYYYQEPGKENETPYKNNWISKIAGWVMVHSGNPSSYADYTNSVGMLFHCRPRGGYSHSFFNENAFDIHAYGQVITHGGASTANRDIFADQTMSHNSILVDGKGQHQHRLYPLSKKAHGFIRLPFKRVGYIAAFDKSQDYLYWVGDATNAYAETTPYLKRFRRHVLFIKNKYFVIFDELRTDPDHEPSKFYWLYHIYPDVAVSLNEEKFEYEYQLKRVKVKVKHIANNESLLLENRRGMDGYINPITGEDYTRYVNTSDPIIHNNIWISNENPANKFNFLTVIFPYQDSDTEPVISKLDDLTVKVEYEGSQQIISFDKNTAFDADITVNYISIE